MSIATEETIAAIKLAMELEKEAAEFYKDAAEKAQNLSHDLLNQLVQFELHHYEKLTELLDSLENKGEYIAYESIQPLKIDRKPTEKIPEDKKLSLMEVITIALKNEKEAEDIYMGLVDKTDDVEGKLMFRKLAEEEKEHYNILSDAYWDLNNKGEW